MNSIHDHRERPAILGLVILTLFVIVTEGHAASAGGGGKPESHWAFQPIVRPEIPSVQRGELCRNPVDAFVLAKLEAHGLSFTKPARRHTLLRRLTANLLGLAPSIAAVQQFEADTSATAYAQLVERVLESPHYGERWGRHWLDVARFAESNGFVENNDWPHIWRYRDWVVQSFNDDKPFDRFLTQQIAGDELTPYADENIIATGFLAAARIATEELSCVRQENDMYVDMVNATSSAVLGLTMGCAQCHDHMFDPLTQEDYYRFQAFFIRGYPGNLVLKSSEVDEEFHEASEQLAAKTLEVQDRVLTDAYQQHPESMQKVMKTAATERTVDQEAKYRVLRASANIFVGGCNADLIMPEEKKELDELRGKLDADLANVNQTRGFYSPATSPHGISALPMKGNFPLVYNRKALAERAGFFLMRGDPYQPLRRVMPGFPDVLEDGSAATGERELTRTDLAKWVTSPKNPLTARVWVNRIWLHHFGRGLVSTPGNFGIRGAAPSHPKLLDYLASELIDSGWSTKHVQRLIVNSETYRQAAHADSDGSAIASEKLALRRELYGQWPLRRLESEAIRDMLLAVSGKLDVSLGGRSVRLPSNRRSLYLFQKRDNPAEMQTLFDAPTAMSASCARREVSTSALQPLFLLNSPFAVDLSESFAESLKQEFGNDLDLQIESLFLRVLARKPDEFERSAAHDYLVAACAEPVESWPRIVDIQVSENACEDVSEEASSRLARFVQQEKLDCYTLHKNGFADHTPNPDDAAITFRFERSEEVCAVELIAHRNGITRIEGFVGDAENELVSVGMATTPAGGRDKPYAEHSVHRFEFDPQRIASGTIFRVIVRETTKADGYANYQIYPLRINEVRIPAARSIDPNAALPQSPLARLCQAMLNLNEFLYVP